jgi:hypothetical protein
MGMLSPRPLPAGLAAAASAWDRRESDWWQAVGQLGDSLQVVVRLALLIYCERVDGRS